MESVTKRRQRHRDWYYAHREKRLEKIREWHKNSPVRKAWEEKNKEKMVEWNREYQKNLRKNKSYLLKRKKQNAMWYIKNREHALSRSKLYIQKVRLQALILYSGNPPHCRCCGETEYDFLTIEHINGGGRKHRQGKSSQTFHLEIIKENNPDKYEVLCMNCNHAKGIHGICPHQKKNIEDALNMQIKVIGDGKKGKGRTSSESTVYKP